MANGFKKEKEFNKFVFLNSFKNKNQFCFFKAHFD